MSKRSDKEFLWDMFIGCKRILEYTANIEFTEFLDSLIVQDAVIRNMEILGEAAKNISMPFRQKYSNINWSAIAKARDKFIHYYFGIDTDRIWFIVQNDIPKLYSDLHELIIREGWQDILDEI